MKYCLSSRQPKTVLKKADEIKIELRDYKAIPDYVDNYPEKTLILDMNDRIPEDFTWDMLPVYSEKMNGNFYCALRDLSLASKCKELGVKFYYHYAATSFFELDGLKKLGVSYVLIGIPLIFDLPNVASYGVPVRVQPNIAYEPYIARENGIIGGWIRPEDVDKYGEYVDVMEFAYCSTLDKEATLYHVYVENKTWPGNLNLLIENLNFDFNNQMLYDEKNFADRRMRCKQKCLNGKSCHYCEQQLKFETLLRKYASN